MENSSFKFNNQDTVSFSGLIRMMRLSIMVTVYSINISILKENKDVTLETVISQNLTS